MVFSDRIKTLLLVAIVENANSLGYLSEIKIIESNEGGNEVSTKTARMIPPRPRRERDEGPERNAIYTSSREDGTSDLLDSSRKLDSTPNEEKDLKLGI